MNNVTTTRIFKARIIEIIDNEITCEKENGDLYHIKTEKILDLQKLLNKEILLDSLFHIKEITTESSFKVFGGNLFKNKWILLLDKVR